MKPRPACLSSRRAPIPRGVFLALSCAWLGLEGCRANAWAAEPRATSATNPIARQFATLDATVWRDELLAQRHEAVFVQLADALRRAADRPAVLSAFEFESIQIPRRLGEPAVLTDGIRRQRFDDTAL